MSEHAAVGSRGTGLREKALRYALALMQDRAAMEAPVNAAIVEQYIGELYAAISASVAPAACTQCESCGRYVDPDPETPDGRGHRVTNSDGSPGYCGPVTPVPSDDDGLRAWVQHKRTCRKNACIVDECEFRGPCTCGLDAALARLRERIAP